MDDNINRSVAQQIGWTNIDLIINRFSYYIVLGITISKIMTIRQLHQEKHLR